MAVTELSPLQHWRDLSAVWGGVHEAEGVGMGEEMQ
jgi:hypothetical protein